MQPRRLAKEFVSWFGSPIWKGHLNSATGTNRWRDCCTNRPRAQPLDAWRFNFPQGPGQPNTCFEHPILQSPKYQGATRAVLPSCKSDESAHEELGLDALPAQDIYPQLRNRRNGS